MKNLLAKLSFKDTPAQEALFAITLWGIGLYVMFSLLLSVTLSGLVPLGNQNTAVTTWVALGLLGALSIYLGVMLFRFYYQSCREMQREPTFWAVLALCCVIAAAAVNYGGAAGFIIAAALFGAWLLPLLLIPKIRWCCYLAHALSWTLGALLLIAMLIRAVAEKNNVFGLAPGKSEPGYYTKLIASYELSDGGWIFLVLLSLVLILAGYLLTAKIFGDSRSVPFRKMFGKGVLTLWGLAIATYLIYLGMAIAASHQTAKNIKDLEQRFGRPVTVETLGKLYYGNDQADPEFWKNIEKYFDQCNIKVDTIDFGYNPDTAAPAPLLTRWRQQFDNPGLAAWEQAFSTGIPPEERQYKTGTLAFMELRSMRSIRLFSRQEFWRIRFALMDNDVKSALAAYGRMTKADDFLLRETNLIGGLVWMACQNIRLNALQLLLESGKLTDAQLQTFAADLQTTEKQIPAIHERCLYSEAVFGMDVIEMVARGFETFGTKHKTAPYQTLRFVFPQLWWYAAVDKGCMAKRYNISSFAEMTEPDAAQKAMLFSGSMQKELKAVAFKFDRLTARLRAAGVVIRAVEYQRQHGEYPKTLANLPLDPFNNQPLQYRVGECEVRKSTVIPNGNSWKIVYQEETVPAVLCWSVGSDQINDNGISRNLTKGKKQLDDISFMIEIKP